MVCLVPGAFAASKTIAVLPFTVNAAKDYSFLQQGLMDMLSSRLSAESEFQPIEKNKTLEVAKSYPNVSDEKSAQSVGKALQADYVIFGSITVLGESVSIDGRILDISQNRVLDSVFTQAKTMDEVVPQINEFAQSIGGRILGKTVAVAEKGQEEKPAPLQQEPEAAPKSSVLTPAYLLSPTEKIQTQQEKPVLPQKEPEVAPKSSAPAPAHPLSPTEKIQTQPLKLNPEFMVEAQSEGEEMIWRSGNIPFHVKGLDIGDLNGDGKNELVVIGPKDLIVYRKDQAGLIQVQKIGANRFEQFITVEVADIDKDGRAEVYAVKERGASGLTESTVLEWQDKGLQPVINQSDWYFRVLEVPDEGPQLIGQIKRGENTFEDTPVYQLEKRGNEIVQGPEISLPRSTNVYNFAFASFEGKAKRIVRINSSESLQVLDTGGEVLWESDSYFGGTVNYLTKKAANPGTEESPERLYVPARIIVADLDGDGSSDVIVNNNTSTTHRLTERYKYFSRGQMVSLSWKDLGLVENWATRNISGYISDYVYKDLDNDGHRDLVVAVVKLDPSGFKKGNSTIISFALRPQEKQAP
jgi:TolB-like protein